MMCLWATLTWACTGDPDRQPQQPEAPTVPDAAADAGGLDDDAGPPEEDAGGGDEDAGPIEDAGGGDEDAGADEDAGEDAGDEPDMQVTQLRADTLVPPRGPVDGGTPFVIEGVGFTDTTAVYFGGAIAQVTLIEGNLVGETPAGVAPGSVDVKLLDATYGNDTLIGGFTYSASLRLTQITPTDVPTRGGVELTVEGAGFDAQTRLSLGGETALRHEVLSPTLMRVLAPAGAEGPADARLTNASATVTLADAVNYFAPLEIEGLTPATGDTAGGSAVTVEGTGFAQGDVVEFDNVAAAVVSVSSDGTRIEVTTPPGAAGLADVRVVSADGDATIAPDAFFYDDGSGLTLAALEPSAGPSSGGVEVTLTGAQLDDPNLEVLFGGAPATILSQGAGVAVVRTPAGSVGAVDVTVNAGGQTSTLPGAYDYVADIWIDRITPNTADAAGGVQVLIEGEGYAGATKVLFGGVAAAFTVDSGTEITATVPSRSAGVVDVVVERGPIKATFRDGFTYTEELDVYGMFPVRGSIAGGTYVELRGKGFVGGVDVTFGGAPAAEVTVLDAQTLSARTPPGVSGPVDVEVTSQGETFVAPEPFTYFNPGARFGGSWGGAIRGSVNVTVYSYAGTPIETAFVMLSTRPDTRYQGYTDANGMITLSGPEVYGSQTVTAIAAGHSSATVQAVDAENLTVFLQPEVPPSQGPPPTPPAPARFEGTLKGLNKLAEPGASQFKIAYVYTTQSSPGRENPPPGPDAVILADGDYAITSRLGDLALVALGGIYDNRTGTFTPIAMGVQRYLTASEGQTYQIDLDLNIPLDQSMTVKLNDTPFDPVTGPNQTFVKPWMDMGFDGIFGELGNTEGPGGANLITVTGLPALAGDLADVQYDIEGGAQNVTPQGASYPLSLGFRRDVTDTSGLIELPGLLGVAEFTAPNEGAAPTNGLVSFNYNSARQPDMFQVQIVELTLAGPVPYWDVFLPGTARSVRIPQFPDFSALPEEDRPAPFKSISTPVLIYAIERPGVDVNNFTYGDLDPANWDAYSLAVRFIRL
jgi:hypothetical protein